MPNRCLNFLRRGAIGRHQDNHVSNGPSQNAKARKLFANSYPYLSAEGVRLSRPPVFHEFDSYHETALPDVTDLR